MASPAPPSGWTDAPQGRASACLPGPPTSGSFFSRPKPHVFTALNHKVVIGNRIGPALRNPGPKVKPSWETTVMIHTASGSVDLFDVTDTLTLWI